MPINDNIIHLKKILMFYLYSVLSLYLSHLADRLALNIDQHFLISLPHSTIIEEQKSEKEKKERGNKVVCRTLK